MANFKRTRTGDQADHPGKVITGNDTHLLNKRKTSRRGDIYNCDEHGPSKIIAKITTSSGAEDYISGNKKISHTVSIAACGAKIITGSDDSVSDK